MTSGLLALEQPATELAHVQNDIGELVCSAVDKEEPAAAQAACSAAAQKDHVPVAECVQAVDSAWKLAKPECPVVVDLAAKLGCGAAKKAVPSIVRGICRVVPFHDACETALEEAFRALEAECPTSSGRLDREVPAAEMSRAEHDIGELVCSAVDTAEPAAAQAACSAAAQADHVPVGLCVQAVDTAWKLAKPECPVVVDLAVKLGCGAAKKAVPTIVRGICRVVPFHDACEKALEEAFHALDAQCPKTKLTAVGDLVV